MTIENDVLRKYGNSVTEFYKITYGISTGLFFSNFSNYRNRFTMPGDTEGIFYRYVIAFALLPVLIDWPSFQYIKPANKQKKN